MEDIDRELMVRLLLGGSNDQMPPLGERVIGMTPEGRPAYLNPGGSVSTERSATVTDPLINRGRPTNIPTIFNDREMDQDAAAQYIAQHGGIMGAAPGSGLVVDPVTGRRLPAFPSIPAAVDAASNRSSHELGLDLFKAYRPDLLRR